MTILDRLRYLIREQLNDIADDVATGAANDYAEYKELVGKIAGLAIAERLLLDVLEKMDGDDA